jgi:heat shock protein HslJ
MDFEEKENFRVILSGNELSPGVHLRFHVDRAWPVWHGAAARSFRHQRVFRNISYCLSNRMLGSSHGLLFDLAQDMGRFFCAGPGSRTAFTRDLRTIPRDLSLSCDNYLILLCCRQGHWSRTFHHRNPSAMLGNYERSTACGNTVAVGLAARARGSLRIGLTARRRHGHREISEAAMRAQTHRPRVPRRGRCIGALIRKIADRKHPLRKLRAHMPRTMHEVRTREVVHCSVRPQPAPQAIESIIALARVVLELIRRKTLFARERKCPRGTLIGLAALAAAVVQGCATAPAPVERQLEAAPVPTPAPAPVPDGSWELVTSSFIGAGRIPGVPRATLRFKDGQLSAFSGCNSASSRARSADGRLEVPEFSASRRECPEPLKTFDARFFKLLRSQPVLRIDGDGLTLVEHELNARFRRVAGNGP